MPVFALPGSTSHRTDNRTTWAGSRTTETWTRWRQCTCPSAITPGARQVLPLAGSGMQRAALTSRFCVASYLLFASMPCPHTVPCSPALPCPRTVLCPHTSGLALGRCAIAARFVQMRGGLVQNSQRVRTAVYRRVHTRNAHGGQWHGFAARAQTARPMDEKQTFGAHNAEVEYLVGIGVVPLQPLLPDLSPKFYRGTK